MLNMIPRPLAIVVAEIFASNGYLDSSLAFPWKPLDKLENANREAPHTNAAWLEELLPVKLLLLMMKQYKSPQIYQSKHT